jgi:hypothetical protein
MKMQRVAALLPLFIICSLIFCDLWRLGDIYALLHRPDSQRDPAGKITLRIFNVA